MSLSDFRQALVAKTPYWACKTSRTFTCAQHKGIMILLGEPFKRVDLGKNIWLIVNTGGVCGGKSTAMSKLRRWLTDRGYKVIVGVESATKLIQAGMGKGELGWADFQEEILLDILAQEERLVSIAKRFRDKGHKVVVLLDRGVMDNAAYMEKGEFPKLLARHGLTERDVCEERYDAVMHLRTAADGAEAFYTLANNEARDETPEQARALDQRTLLAWHRHHHPRVIDNSTNFEDKIRRLFAEICAVLGDPVPLEKEQKFLIKPFDESRFPVEWVKSRIVQDYLLTPDPREERRVRARGDDLGCSYSYAMKRYVAPGIRVEDERIITRREYDALLTLRNPRMRTIKKDRICFFWKHQFFEIDRFLEPCDSLHYMEAERTDLNPKLEVPEFIKVVEEVTGIDRHSNSKIALIPQGFV